MDFADKSTKVSEAESHHEECRESNGHKYFGIKSYLHNFYENVRNSDLDDFDEDSSLSHPKEGRNKRATCWTATLVAGFLSMFGGSALLAVGFTFPRMKIDIGYQEEMRIIDKSAYEFNEHLEQVKGIGLFMFAVGGILVASALLLPSLLCSDTEEAESRHFKLRIVDDCDPDGADQNLIPITEELKEIQPRGQSTTVITNAGLKQIDHE